MSNSASATPPSRADLYTLELPTDGEWRKSPFSVDGHCVQILPLPGGGVAIRDSKNPDGPVLLFTTAEWEAFRLGLITGAL
jgi:hypothetical protein